MTQKSTILAFLATSLLVALVNGTPNPTRELKFSSSNPHTVAIGSDLVTVSYYNLVIGGQRKAYYNLTSTSNNYKPCIIPLDPKLDMIRSKIKAASLKSKIVVWGDGDRKVSEINTLQYYKVYLIDPKTCTHRVLPNVVDKEPDFLYGIKPEVSIHQDRFDIFYPSQTECSPCTFDLDGNKVGVTQQLKSQATKLQFYVRTVGKSHRYVTAYHLLNESVAVTLFDESLNLERSKILDSNTKLVGAAINSVENEPLIGIISTFLQSRVPVYIVFDSKLNIVFETLLPLLDDYQFDDAFANIDSLGNSYVTLIQQEKQGPNKKITLVRYNGNGRLIGQVLLGTRPHMGAIVERKEQAALIGEQEYCLITHVRSGYLNPTETTNIKCIDVAGKFD